MNRPCPRSWLARRNPGPTRTYAETLAATMLARGCAIDQAHAYVLAYASTLTASRMAR